MIFLKKNILIFILFFFTTSLIFLFILDYIEKQNASKIILRANKSPFDVQKPEPQNSNLSFEQILESLKKSNQIEDRSLEIDDIE